MRAVIEETLQAALADERGRPLGQVVEPRTARLVGRGAETVLLVRSDHAGDGMRMERSGRG